ncbi:MAG: hypothetical protein H7Z12_10975 [Rhodospirillaceae bacterium]|nr:hypothetical protein [Rhodospirillales bacterium]
MLRQFKWALAVFAACCAATAVAALTWPPLGAMGRSFWDHSELLASALAPGPNPVFFVGASNIGDLAVDDVQSFHALPHRDVHNLTRGAMRVPEMEGLAAYLAEQIAPAARQRAVVIVGLWYGTFVTVRPGADTDRDWHVSMLPFHAGRAVLNAGRTIVLSNLKHAVYTAMPPKRERSRPPEPARLLPEQALAKFAAAYEKVDPDSLEHFAAMVSGLRRAHMRVLLVDMPLPRWHAEASPLAAEYARLKAPMLERLKADPGVAYLDLTSHSDPADFRDATHPQPATLIEWADAIGAAVAALP